jgi:Rrf2 family protein
MKLSTKVRYGTRAMLDLASHFKQDRPVFLKDIAARQEVSLKYLDRILSSLKAASLVKALRGAKGGYILGRAPAQINLKDILEALEGPLELVGCVSNNNYCRRVNACVAHDIWYELGRAMEAVLKTTSLEDLLKREKKKGHGKMYYI